MQPYVVGLVAALALFAFYLTILTLVSGRAFAVRQFGDDYPYFLALLPAFGAQAGLYAYLRVLHGTRSTATALTGANGGISGTAMVACCAHFLPTLLPLVGVSGLATLLIAWKGPLLVLAIAANVAGVAYAGRAVHRMRRTMNIVPAGRDPVCGMPVTEAGAVAWEERDGIRHPFCSAACHERFLEGDLRPSPGAVPTGGH